ncbi:thioester reductase domain-containing protein [Micromonospora tarensis]|uniref:Thioester reductase domain-containing protein n=1 Tax=Micromonospora tarensis TaxID=2806100 RepID=A0ABS1YAB9_9ACTN|nr:thioester reductase domain-containing protein [Micromonospora tarensis]MBM0274302.1 thioester reductase domain-containing protein [Micromonospora tarensis]
MADRRWRAPVSPAPPLSLVTGATGFLGSAIVARLLRQGHSIRCVVRGETDGDRVGRLRAALGDQVDEWSRIEVVPGDLSRSRLGLSEADFRSLGRGVSHVVHCGARVNMTLPYEPLYDTNVRATEDLLDLAAALPASFGYVGSLAAVARGVATEPFELLAPVSGGYAQSKWSADRLVSVAHQEGRLGAVIFRPGRVTADSRTARGNPDDLLEMLVRSCVRLTAAPILRTRVRLSPVDWVSELIVALSGAPVSHGRAYHLISAETLPWTGVVAALRRAGHPLTELPYPQWRALAIAHSGEDPDVARLASALPPTELTLDDRSLPGPINARRTLGGRFPGLPPAESLLDGTIAAWQATGRLPTPLP